MHTFESSRRLTRFLLRSYLTAVWVLYAQRLLWSQHVSYEGSNLLTVAWMIRTLQGLLGQNLVSIRLVVPCFATYSHR